MAFACVSIDIDTTWCYREIHGLPPKKNEAIDPIYRIAVPRLMGFLATIDIPATLFVIGKDLEKRGQQMLLREATALGNELGNHSYAHDYALRDKEKHVVRDDIQRAHDTISEIYGQDVVGFRTPGYNVSGRILNVLAELDYAYDSSVFPCPPYYAAKAGVMAARRIIGKRSRSAMTLPQTLMAPKTPYFPSPRAFWRRAQHETKLPYEIPMCVVPGIRFPIIGTSLHLVSGRRFDLLCPTIHRAHPDLLNLEFHAIDFVDSTDIRDPDLAKVQPDLRIPWATKKQRYTSIFNTIKTRYKFSTLREAIGA